MEDRAIFQEAAVLQADAAARKRHSSQVRIDERYAGIYFIATNNLYSFRDWLV